MPLAPPESVKFRRESEFGLVYEHENYGYEDATLLRVDEAVIDVLERAAEGSQSRDELAVEFSPELVDALCQRGLLTEAERAQRGPTDV